VVRMPGTVEAESPAAGGFGGTETESLPEGPARVRAVTRPRPARDQRARPAPPPGGCARTPRATHPPRIRPRESLPGAPRRRHTGPRGLGR
jgi:hypothetical protein